MYKYDFFSGVISSLLCAGAFAASLVGLFASVIAEQPTVLQDAVIACLALGLLLVHTGSHRFQKGNYPKNLTLRLLLFLSISPIGIYLYAEPIAGLAIFILKSAVWLSVLALAASFAREVYLGRDVFAYYWQG